MGNLERQLLKCSLCECRDVVTIRRNAGGKMEVQCPQCAEADNPYFNTPDIVPDLRTGDVRRAA